MQPAGALIAKTRSLDQARAVVTFLDAASEKTLRSTVALTAARGRGKSAALGLAIAGALALGYSNIFVTAPSPENLRTLFEFIFKVVVLKALLSKIGIALLVGSPSASISLGSNFMGHSCMQGLDALGYSEHIDYDLVESTNPAFLKAIIRVNVFRDHRQVRFPSGCIHLCELLRHEPVTCMHADSPACPAVVQDV